MGDSKIQRQQRMAEDPATGDAQLRLLVERAEGISVLFDNGDESAVPQESLDLIRAVAKNPSASHETLQRCLAVGLELDRHIVGATVTNPNLPQEEVEDLVTWPQGLAQDLTVEEWARALEARDDTRSVLIARLLEGGSDQRQVVEEADAIL